MAHSPQEEKLKPIPGPSREVEASSKNILKNILESRQISEADYCDELEFISGLKENLQKFYAEHVLLSTDIDTVVEKAERTKPHWFYKDVYKFRLRCSKCFPIITQTRKSDEKLLEDVLGLNIKHQSGEQPWIQYGLETPPKARDNYRQNNKNVKIYEFGIIIHKSRPWLCCIPDGIIKRGDNVELLETVCAYNRRDERNFKGNLPKYLKPDQDGNMILTASSEHFVRIQLRLYILGLKMCKLHIYSKNDSITVDVPYNEEKVKEYIPKLKKFYFNLFLPKVST